MSDLITSGQGLDRRGFIKNGVAAGIGAVFAASVGTRTAQAAEAAVPAAAPAAAAPAGLGKKLTMGDVLRVAREKLYPLCRVCPECDGVACAGEVPGMGGIGSGKGFKNNYNALAAVELVMRTFHDMTKPNLAVTIYGHKLEMPVMSAATGGVTYNMGNKMKDSEYINAVFGGCLDAGSLGMAADGIGDNLDVYQGRLNILKSFGGKGMMTIKPKSQEEIIKRIRLIEEAGAVAFAVDIDSAGRAARALPGQIVEPKTAKQLEEIVKSTGLPFIVKGVMTVEEARIAVEVGAKGIVVSNHGGRVLDYTPASVTVLPRIADAVRGKITVFFDGAVRRGTDVLKCLALGADCCLVGRPLVRGAHGGGREGVALMMNLFKRELMDAMVLTGTRDVRNVSRDIIAGGIRL
ncbi:MAG: alpha-hydroxy-acid oxidizing protein [Desulfovibrio sp.]|jgi:isopentenyl diphosphate isomerase/L-lactate dehydrogenase-like FMN-dependent dehydrogenase|nr:alpha-hydroxy-acid oxidizing protein [Desulfovibrio sp.]